MTFAPGELVSYGGRVGRVDGVETIHAAGASFDVLVIVLTGPPVVTARVPVSRAAASVQRVSEEEAVLIAANVPPVRRRRHRTASAELARRRKSGLMGAIAKANVRTAQKIKAARAVELFAVLPRS